MEDSTSEVKIGCRFLKLNKLQAYTLAKEVTGATYKMPRKKGYYVGCVPLTNSSIHEINDFYVHQNIDKSNCDIFVSTVTEYESYAIDI